MILRLEVVSFGKGKRRFTNALHQCSCCAILEFGLGGYWKSPILIGSLYWSVLYRSAGQRSRPSLLALVFNIELIKIAPGRRRCDRRRISPGMLSNKGSERDSVNFWQDSGRPSHQSAEGVRGMVEPVRALSIRGDKTGNKAPVGSIFAAQPAVNVCCTISPNCTVTMRLTVHPVCWK